MHWMFMPLRRYAEFSGRSRRMEYWMFMLGIWILYIVLFAVLTSVTGFMFFNPANPQAAGPAALATSLFSLGIIGIVVAVFWLALLIPSLAVTVRRLHDTNRSGWWLGGLYALIFAQFFVARVSLALGLVVTLAELILGIALIVFMFLEGTRGPNRYGEDPKGPNNAEVFA